MAEVFTRSQRFHVQRMGQGDRTVVFVHGLVMDNLSSWYFSVANTVAKHAQVLLYDLRGHGYSDRPSEGYRIEDHVADLLAILDSETLKQPVDLVGNSFGGLLALAFALAHPGRVRSLVLVDAHTGDASFGEEMAATLSLDGEERNAKIAKEFKHWLGRHSERKRNRLAAAAQDLVLNTTLVEDLRTSTALHPDNLASLTCPVLALYGEHSDVLSRGQMLADTIEQCQCRVFSGCSHSVLWEATEAVTQAIVEWVQQPVEA